MVVAVASGFTGVPSRLKRGPLIAGIETAVVVGDFGTAAGILEEARDGR